MKKTELQCDACPIMGYSPDLCRLHRSHLAKEKNSSSHKQGNSLQSWSVKAAVGAGIGITGAVFGMAALPAFGMKAILGHLVSVKVAGAGGVLGAGANIALNYKKKPVVKQSNEKEGSFAKKPK